MKSISSYRLAICLLLLATHQTARVTAQESGKQHSELWGRQGERWSAESRLPDFSYAGYQRGERPLPRPTADVTVKEFGAVGDGVTDDSKAFQRAINSAVGKAIEIPPGVYLISDILEIRKSGTTLKGAGSDRSILRFSTPLNDIKPNWGATTGGRRTSNYSWSGGFVWVTGKIASETLSKVTAAARRGDQSVEVSGTDQLRIGDEFRLSMSDTNEQSLAKYLYANDPGPIEKLGRRTTASFVARVTGVEASSKRIEFDRPLSTDVQLQWQPIIQPSASSVEEVGIEGIGFEFPSIPYQGHFTELGFNAVAMTGVRNCWVRDLRILNADSGIFVSGNNTTLEGIVFQSQRKVEPSRKATGHHGITLGGQDNLLVDFDFRTRFMHDVTVTRGSAGNVVSSGRGVDLCFDHHRYAPHANLFTDVDLGEGTRMFQSGGGDALGRHSAAWETFWCIRSRAQQQWPTGWGPDLMNFVGIPSNDGKTISANDRWFEPLEPDQLQPANLYQAQLAKRLQR